MRYRVLGPVSAAEGSEPAALGGPRARAVLAMLLADVGRVVTDRQLVAGIWGDDAPDGARHAIQNHVSRLRRAIGDDIAREGGGYRLDVDPRAVDAHRFTSLVASARERLSDAPVAAGLLLREALALWHGEPYADLADVPGLQDDIRQLLATRASAVEDRVQADFDAGGHQAVIAELDTLIREHPFRERLYGMQMLALYRAGRQAEALQAFTRARMLLDDELGIDPSPELAELHIRILTQDPGLQGSHEPSREAMRLDVPHVGDGLPVMHGFELRELVGEGDFGRTYRAYHAALGREVALKVLHAELSDLPDVVAGFERRTQRIAQLDHPHVMPLLDHWRDPGAACVVTPWSSGGAVRAALRHGPWSPAAALRMVEQIGAALELAHRRGIVHGDVKATNILLSDDGSARLSDFAVGPRLRDALGGPRTTDAGAIAPEERRGAPTSTASDVYGLAAIAIAVLTGAPVPAERPIAAVEQHASALPDEAIEALATATAAEPGQRPKRVVDLVRQLRRALGADVVAPTGPAAGDADAALRNPYKGLHAFTEDDAVDFFGRGAAVERLLSGVADHRLIAVVGPSGSGKSSIVRAGAVPALRAGSLPGSQHWLIADLYPGSHPFDELAVALLRVAVDPPADMVAALTADERGLARVVKQILPADDAQLLLVIDQFEELFSLTADPDTRQLFLDSLVALTDDARGRVRTIVTLRADFFDRPLEHHAFGELVRVGLISLTVPSPNELAEAVAAPARQVGVEYAPGLIARIVGDVVDQPGGLPLLQHALTELFARRAGPTLTEQAYVEAGGVRGALARRAEELYTALPAARQELTRQLFLRLVTVDEHAGVTRRRVRRSELAGLGSEWAAIDDTLQRFGAYRLLTFDRDPLSRGPTVEVAHEALLGEWGRLRRWIDDRRDDLLLHRRLTLAAEEWRAADRADGFLATGPRLHQFAELAATTDLALDADERAYLAASRQQAVDTLRQRRRQRWLATAALAGVVMLAVALVGVGMMQRGRAAVRSQLEHAAALASASQAAQRTDAELALLLAREAVRVARAAGTTTGVTLSALHEAVLNHRLVASFDVGHFAVHHLDRRRLIAPSTAGTGPRVYDIGSGKLHRTLSSGDTGADGQIDFALSPDGRRWAEVYAGSTSTTVWDVASGAVIQRLPAVRDGRDWPAFDPTAELLAVVDFSDADERNVIRVYDVDSGAERWRTRLPGRASRIAISPDGRTLAAPMSDDAVVRLFDLETGDAAGHIRGPTRADGIASLAFDPTRSAMTVVYDSGELQIHEPSSGAVIGSAPIDAEDVIDVCYSANGSTIVVSAIGEIEVYRVDTLDRIAHIVDAGIASRASCGPEGTSVAAGSISDRARIWDLTPAAAAEVWSTEVPAPWTADWVGDAIISTHEDRRLRRYVPGRGLTATSGVATPTEPIPLTTDGRGRIATFVREDHPAAASDRLVLRDGNLRIVQTTTAVAEPQAFDADGARLIATEYRAVHVIDTGDGGAIEVPRADLSGLTPPGAAFLPDGRHALVDDLDGTFVLDLRSGRREATVCARAFSSRVVASPQGTLFAVDGPHGIEVFDVERLLDVGSGADPSCDGANPGAAARVAYLESRGARFMDFSPDGTRLATVADDGTVSLWDPWTGELLFAIRHDGEVGGGTFSADGRHLAVTVHDPASGTGSVRIYSLDPDDLLEIADREVTRELTPEECSGYRIADPCGRLSAS